MNAIRQLLTSQKYRFARVGAVSAVAVLLMGGIATGEIDLPWVEQKITNHEERLTTVEGAVQDLATSPTPSPEVTTSAGGTTIVVQEVSTTPGPVASPSPQPTITPAPVIPVSYVVLYGTNCTQPYSYVVTYSNGHKSSYLREEVLAKQAQGEPLFDVNLPHTTGVHQGSFCTNG